MHPNPAFRRTSTVMNMEFVQSRSFGTLAINAPDGPLLSHVPVLLSQDGGTADLHLVRSNPIVRLLDAPRPAVIALTGPDSYISPDWYEVPDQVPTWNYTAVHLRGTLELLPQDQLHDMLVRLTAHFEDRLLPKTPWLDSKMSDGVMEKMMRAIVPCRMTITKIDGTWKLGQNKPEAVRLAAAAQVRANGLGQETTTLSYLMADPPKS